MTSAVIDLLAVEAAFLAAFVGIIGASIWHKDTYDGR
jgi:hypothetical protein